MTKPTSRRSSISKSKHNLSGSICKFKVTSVQSNKPTISKATIYENHGILSVKAKENVFYVLLKKPDLGYSLNPDFCYSVKLIPYSNQLMQVDGYRCKFGEQVKVSTCFGYVSLITFSTSTEHQVPSGHKDIELVRNEVGDRYVELYAFNELDKLNNGQSVLLRVEIDTNSMTQYKLILEYILKASTPTSAHEQISRKAPSSLNSIVDYNVSFVELNRRMDLITDRLNIVPRDVILVCGASNCGKSTLIHHMINRYLSNDSGHSMVKKALYLECDPGQTEFAPSGILSLITIDKKVLSSPGFKFISGDHPVVLTKPRKIVSKIFGTNSPSENTSTYVSLIKDLINEAKLFNQESEVRMPLFINTMGWIEDLGLELLLKIIDLAEPTHVIRIESTNEFTENYNRLRHEGIILLGNSKKNKYSNPNLPQDIPSLANSSRAISFKLWLAFHCVNDFSMNSPYKNAALRREINQLAYVTHSFWPEISYLPFFMNFTAKLPLENLFVHCVGNPNICPSSVYDLLNASWVILGNISPTEVAKIDSTSFSKSHEKLKLIHHELINGNCLGCGVVRAVDLSEKCMHILMPKALDSYRNTINLIVLPDLIAIPSGLMSEQFLYQSSSCLPFIFSYFEPK